jgi:hypothetical protein
LSLRNIGDNSLKFKRCSKNIPNQKRMYLIKLTFSFFLMVKSLINRYQKQSINNFPLWAETSPKYGTLITFNEKKLTD